MTTTTSLTADQVKEKIVNTKGNYIKIRWKSEPKPSKLFKEFHLEKVTSGVVRAGINYANLSTVKEGIESGAREAVQSLPWGEWLCFPYTIIHKDALYYRLYPSEGNGHRCSSLFYVNGENVTKEEFSKYLTPSDAKKLLEPEKEVLCFTVKADSILDIPEEIN